jgi:DUF1680 family protein
LQRVLASLPGYLYGASKDGLYVHLFHPSTVETKLAKLTQTTRYPWDGEVTIRVEPAASQTFALYVRIPQWSAKTAVEINGSPVKGVAGGSYLKLHRTWKTGDTVRLRLDTAPRLTAANLRVRDNIGKVAVERGPLVYCMEAVDQTAPIWETAITSGPFEEETSS